jgi:hypothetical protein
MECIKIEKNKIVQIKNKIKVLPQISNKKRQKDYTK